MFNEIFNEIFTKSFIKTKDNKYIYYPFGKHHTCYIVSPIIRRKIINSYKYYFFTIFYLMIIFGFINVLLPLLLLLTIPIYFSFTKHLWYKDSKLKWIQWITNASTPVIVLKNFRHSAFSSILNN